MNKKLVPLLGLLLVGLCGCQNNSKTKKSDVISQRYIHKYGYDVSPEEWKHNHYPGQVVTTLKNGVTIASSYEDGVLHGPTSYTYPHSQTLESLQVFERGNLVKRTSFDIKGIPMKEDLFLSPGHVKTKTWYRSGTPMCSEEKLEDALIEGEYYTLQNEIESKVEDAHGIKTVRSIDGDLIAKETISQGEMIIKETFHSDGKPATIAYFTHGLLHGEKKFFGPSGEPVLVEHYHKGKLHGPCSYYQNGCKYLETTYIHGRKEGVEKQFIDGETLVEETEYHLGLKHGPSIFYCDGMSKTEWYYNDQFVSKTKFDDLTERERMISIMNDRSKSKISDDEGSFFELDALESLE